VIKDHWLRAMFESLSYVRSTLYQSGDADGLALRRERHDGGGGCSPWVASSMKKCPCQRDRTLAEVVPMPFAPDAAIILGQAGPARQRVRAAEQTLVADRIRIPPQLRQFGLQMARQVLVEFDSHQATERRQVFSLASSPP
jgi:hypothetical protein